MGSILTALTERGNDSDALLTLGAFHALQDEHEEALEVLNRLALLDPGYPGLWWLKSRVFTEFGKEKAAEAVMRRVLEVRPDLAGR